MASIDAFVKADEIIRTLSRRRGFRQLFDEIRDSDVEYSADTMNDIRRDIAEVIDQ